MNFASLRALPFVAALFPLDCLVAAALLASAAATAPLRMRARKPPGFPPPDRSAVTIQILNWDGEALLREHLPSVVEAARRHEAGTGARVEVLIVDNGSRDGSVALLRAQFPDVRILELDRNHGFSIGNNRGFEHVHSDIVVLLNNDMLVRPDFLEPLLQPFSDPAVFAVTSQLLFADPARRREETGKTRGVFEAGFFRLWHDDMHPEDETRAAMPVFWAGGGACAIDRRKLAVLGGFDPLYRPWYVEDVDLSYQAWKRGWKSLLAPQSLAVHKHRGTSRRKFGDRVVDRTIRRNQYLFVWKNVTDLGMLLRHLTALPRNHGKAIVRGGARAELRAYTQACLRLPQAIRQRAVNLREYTETDAEVLREGNRET